VKKNAIMLILAQSPNMPKLMQNQLKRVVKGQVFAEFVVSIAPGQPQEQLHGNVK